MEIMKNIMLKNGINLEEITEFFYKYNSKENAQESIKASRAYILIMCNKQRKRIWDVVQETMTEDYANKEFSENQKTMAKASLLLAWEDLEKNDEQLCLEIQKNALAN